MADDSHVLDFHCDECGQSYSVSGTDIRCPQCGSWPEEDPVTKALDSEDGIYGVHYSDRFYGEDWQKVRQRVLERDDHRCQGCGLTDEEHRRRDGLFPPDQGLHVHHQTPARLIGDPDEANQLENLVALCDKCHRKAEVEFRRQNDWHPGWRSTG